MRQIDSVLIRVGQSFRASTMQMVLKIYLPAMRHPIINGVRLGEYKGGYTPFSFELTPHLDFSGENVLAVDVDSTERSDIPPFGYEIDYLTFGGIYREVALRIVPGQALRRIQPPGLDIFIRNHQQLVGGQRNVARGQGRGDGIVG